MFETIKRLYLEGKLDNNGVKKAVKKGMITQEDCEKILRTKNS